MKPYDHFVLAMAVGGILVSVPLIVALRQHGRHLAHSRRLRLPISLATIVAVAMISPQLFPSQGGAALGGLFAVTLQAAHWCGVNGWGQVLVLGAAGFLLPPALGGSLGLLAGVALGFSATGRQTTAHRDVLSLLLVGEGVFVGIGFAGARWLSKPEASALVSFQDWACSSVLVTLGVLVSVLFRGDGRPGYWEQTMHIQGE